MVMELEMDSKGNGKRDQGHMNIMSLCIALAHSRAVARGNIRDYRT